MQQQVSYFEYANILNRVIRCTVPGYNQLQYYQYVIRIWAYVAYI